MNPMSSTTRSGSVPVRIYTPGWEQKLGVRIWGLMLADVWRSRDLIWRLFWKQWVGQYRQTWLGYFWAIAPTLVAVLAFVLLRRHVLPKFKTPIPYVAYAMWGMTAWQFFSSCFQSAMNALQESGPMISRIQFPRESLVFASIGKNLFTFFLRLAAFAILIIVLYAKREVVQWAIPRTILLAPFSLIPLFFLAVGLGMIMAVLLTLAGDVSNVTPLILQFGVFVTPGVMFPSSPQWPYLLLGLLNPVSAVIEGSQDLLAAGRLTQPNVYAAMTLFSLLVFLAGWRFFRLALPRIQERF